MKDDDTDKGDRKRITIRYIGHNTRANERRKNKKLKRRSDLDDTAREEFIILKHEYDQIGAKYRPVGFESSAQAFSCLTTLYEDFTTCKEGLSDFELSVIDQIKYSADWILKGLEKQEELLDDYITKFKHLETVHNVRIRYVDHAMLLWYETLGDKLWLKSNKHHIEGI